MGRILVFFLLLLTVPLALRAEEAKETHPHIAVLRALAVNRSLLMKAEAEYHSLLQEEPQNPAEEIAKRLDSLRYKIQAFQDDAERLRRSLPTEEKADEFMKELLERQQTLGTPQSTVDPQAEKDLERKTRDILRMHEEALAYVARDRLEEAGRLYEEILLVSPDDDEAYLLLGHTCLVRGRYEKAARAFQNAVNIDPANTRAIPRLYQNVLVENPSDDEAMAQLGYAYLLLGNAGEARQSFEEALKLNPANDQARRGLLEIP